MMNGLNSHTLDPVIVGVVLGHKITVNMQMPVLTDADKDREYLTAARFQS